MEKSGATAGDVKIKEYTFFQYTFHFLRSNCRQKHIKSNFFAYMRPVSDFIITVREQKPDFFRIRPRSGWLLSHCMSYVVLNPMHIRCFWKRLQSEWSCCIISVLYVILKGMEWQIWVSCLERRCWQRYLNVCEVLHITTPPLLVPTPHL